MKPSLTDPTIFLQRISSKKFHQFLKRKKRRGRRKIKPDEAFSDEFRWTSQLSTSTKTIRAELQEFYDQHNKNVLAFQALVDDPNQSTSSRVQTLDSHIYSQILETDIYLRNVKDLLTEVELLLVEMMEICREKYIGDKMYPLLERPFGSPSLDQRFLMLPDYVNSQSTESSIFDPPMAKTSKASRNEWVLTDADGKVIRSNNQRRGHDFKLSSICSASDGILSYDEAVIQVFVGVSEILHHLIILPSDVCIVHIDSEKRIATVKCQRWGNYTSEKTFRLRKFFCQIETNRQFYFKCQPVNPQSERLCQVLPQSFSPFPDSFVRRKKMTKLLVDGFGANHHGVVSTTLLFLTSISF